jgi:transcriptional regulator with XRE-family HTH domain
MFTFGKKLKELRAACGMTQAKLASASGVPIGTIRDYEQGKRDPLLSTAQKLSGAFGRGLDVFDDVKSEIKRKSASKAKPKKGKRKG